MAGTGHRGKLNPHVATWPLDERVIVIRGQGTVKLTNLSAYSAPSPLSKLLILHPSVDRFRLQNSRFLLNLTIPVYWLFFHKGV